MRKSKDNPVRSFHKQTLLSTFPYYILRPIHIQSGLSLVQSLPPASKRYSNDAFHSCIQSHSVLYSAFTTPFQTKAFKPNEKKRYGAEHFSLYSSGKRGVCTHGHMYDNIHTEPTELPSVDYVKHLCTLLWFFFSPCHKPRYQRLSICKDRTLRLIRTFTS